MICTLFLAICRSLLGHWVHPPHLVGSPHSKFSREALHDMRLQLTGSTVPKVTRLIKVDLVVVVFWIL